MLIRAIADELIYNERQNEVMFVKALMSPVGPLREGVIDRVSSRRRPRQGVLLRSSSAMGALLDGGSSTNHTECTDHGRLIAADPTSAHATFTRSGWVQEQVSSSGR